MEEKYKLALAVLTGIAIGVLGMLLIWVPHAQSPQTVQVQGTGENITAGMEIARAYVGFDDGDGRGLCIVRNEMKNGYTLETRVLSGQKTAMTNLYLVSQKNDLDWVDYSVQHIDLNATANFTVAAEAVEGNLTSLYGYNRTTHRYEKIEIIGNNRRAFRFNFTDSQFWTIA